MTDRPTWMTEGACLETDPDIWFPSLGGTGVEAKSICSGCDVLARCLQWAVDRNERWGIWGGHTYEERINLRRRAMRSAQQEAAA